MTERDDIDARHALAEAWASMDGRLGKFRDGRNAASFEEEVEKFGGHYSGYLAEADELMARLARRGFTVARQGE